MSVLGDRDDLTAGCQDVSDKITQGESGWYCWCQRPLCNLNDVTNWPEFQTNDTLDRPQTDNSNTLMYSKMFMLLLIYMVITIFYVL